MSACAQPRQTHSSKSPPLASAKAAQRRFMEPTRSRRQDAGTLFAVRRKRAKYCALVSTLRVLKRSSWRRILRFTSAQKP